MPVQIPMLQRDQAPSDASVGRIDYKQPDLLTPVTEVGKAAEGTVNEFEKVAKAHTMFTAENEANKARADFRSGHDVKLNGNPGSVDPTTGAQISPPTLGAKQKAETNDPSQVFAQFDNDIQSLKNTISDRYKDADPIVQSRVNQSLNEEARRGYNISNTAYRVAQNSYVDRTSKAAIDMNNQDMSTAAGNLDQIRQDDEENPNVQNPIDEALRKNRMTVGNKYMQQGGGGVTPVTDPNDKSGVPKIIDYKFVSDQAKAELKKANSQGIFSAIKSTLIPGQSTDNAQFLMDKYGDQLDKTHKPQIQDALAKAQLDADATELYLKYQDKSFPEAIAAIKSSGADPKVQLKAMANIDSYRKYMENSTASASKDNYQAATSEVFKLRQAGQMPVDVNALENNPKIAPFLPKITDPKMRQALDDMIEPPKVSEPDAKLKIQDAYFNGDLKGMNATDFSLYTRGLSKEDQTWATNEWSRLNNPGEGQDKTIAQQTAQTKSLKPMLDDAMLEAGLTKHMFGTKELDSNSEKFSISANQKLIDAADTLPPNMSLKDKQAWVKNFVSTELKKTGGWGDLLNKAEGFFGFGNSKKSETPVLDTSKVPGVQPTSDQKAARQQLINQTYQRLLTQPGRTSAPTPQEVIDIVDKKSGK